MKLIIIIMTASLLQVSAAGFAQKVTFSQKQVSLEQLFKEITKQTGYQVFYADKGIDAAKLIDANFKNAELTDVLNKCLQKQALTYVIEDKSIVIKVEAQSMIDKMLSYMKSIDVKGKVLDESGKPLPKASIRIKGTDRTVQSNENGEFQFNNVDENAILQVFYLGYKTKEFEARTLKLNETVQLEVKTKELEEVAVMVNTGYQNLPKERATGSFSQVSNEVLNKQVGGNILNRLDGVANGINFDKRSSGIRPKIAVRGISTIEGVNTPLIILDNFPYEGDVSNINPNDIENITVLKDAAAASIWGTRAGNGVIVITTKKGKFNQPLKIAFNSNVTITDKPNLFDIRQMSTSDFIDVEQKLFALGAYQKRETDKTKLELSPVVEFLIAARDKKITDAQAKIEIDALRNNDLRNDASKYLYRTAVDQQYALNFQGGSEKMTYHVSGGYDRNLSSLSDQYERINLRAANTFRPIDKLQITTSLYYTNSNSKSGKPAYKPNSIGQSAYPYTRLVDVNGNGIPLDVYRKTYTDTAGMGKLLDWKYYPLEDYKHNTTKTKLQSMMANVGLNYELNRDLNVDLKYQYENQQVKTNNLMGLESFATRDLLNSYSKLDRKTGVVTYNVPYGGVLRQSDANITSQNTRLQLNYNKTIGDHAVVALAGAEVRQISTNSVGGYIYGYDDDILTRGKPDYAHSYPSFISGSPMFLNDGLNALGGKLNNYVSYFGNASYTYKGKYSLSGSVRKDMSNLFGVKTNEKGVPLWSAGGSWNISDESFYNVSFLPYLKLRTTYGISGNVDSRKSAVTTLVGNGAAFYTGLPQSFIKQYRNPELRWERVKMFNIGADFQLVNNVLSGSIEYYHKKGLDLFGIADIDYTTTGVGTMVKNVANMVGKGIDVELNSKIIDRTFKWTQLFNFSYNKDKVTKYLQRSTYGTDYLSDGIRAFPLKGQPVYALVSYKWAGLDPLTGDPMGYLNGQPSKDYIEFTGSKSQLSDLVYSGSAIPVVFGNFMNTFSWKALSLSVNVTYKMGHYFRRQSVNYNALLTNFGHTDYADRWQKPGDEKTTNVPSFIYPLDQIRNNFYNSSSVLVTKADHIRLQFVNLAYNLTKQNYSKLPVQQLQLFANASNLGLLWKANKYGIDPEYDNNLRPKASFSLGLRANL